jgi:LAS seventeen-binding protein 5
MKKPYTAVTVQIEHLTSEQYEVDDSSGIVDLIEVVRMQASGPTEASRALRKKLSVSNDIFQAD